jgi:hypothetical protein
MKIKLNNEGFGIMSLLITLSFIMVLSVMIIPMVSQTMTNNQVTSMETTVTNLQTDVQSFMGNGGSFTDLGIGNETTPSTINGLQSVNYRYLVPVSWTPNTVLNASYSSLTTQNGWYNIPNGSFATAYLVTAGSNVFTGSNPPEFALGIYAPAMTNSQANTVINYLQSKEPSGSFDEFIWNNQLYTWNSTKNWGNSSNQTIPLNSSTGNGQLIFGFNGYLQTAAATSMTINESDPMVWKTPGQYQFTTPPGYTNITITCAGGGGGGYNADAGGYGGGAGEINSYTFTSSQIPPSSTLTIYVAGGGNDGYGGGSSGGYGGYGGGYGGGGGAGYGGASNDGYGNGGGGGAGAGVLGTTSDGPQGGIWSYNDSSYIPAQNGWVEISW